MSLILEVKNITVQFGGVIAVDNASLSINKGDLTGFIGPNGAGKTTLMRVITGIIKPDAGSVLLEGNDLLRKSISSRIGAGLGLAQQIVQPLKGMTLAENVTLAAGKQHARHPIKAMTMFKWKAEKSFALEQLERVGLKDASDSLPSELPLGYLKRLEVARALALRPKLLLLDEPLAGLNQSEAAALANLIQRLNEDGLTILLIEHNLREVVRICPQVYVQEQGRSLAFGPTNEVMSRSDVVTAYIGGN